MPDTSVITYDVGTTGIKSRLFAIDRDQAYRLEMAGCELYILRTAVLNRIPGMVGGDVLNHPQLLARPAQILAALPTPLSQMQGWSSWIKTAGLCGG